jgi:hypothetical protein
MMRMAISDYSRDQPEQAQCGADTDFASGYWADVVGEWHMHTILVIALGFGLLAVCALVGRMFGGTSGIATAALAFLPLWVVGAGINMYIGVMRAGYSATAEAPIFVIVFGVPAAVALFAWTKLR